VADAGFGEERREVRGRAGSRGRHLAEEDRALGDVADDAGRTSSAPISVIGAHEGRKIELDASRLSFSIPFCSDSTVVLSSTTAAICRASAAVSY
jgi:hypothetical protein